MQKIKIIQLNTENIAMITIKHFEMNQILVLGIL